MSRTKAPNTGKAQKRTPELPSKWATLLGGSWVVKSRVISKVSILLTHIRGRITPLITTHEPPSTS